MNRPNMIPCASCGVDNNILSRQQEKEFTCYNCGEDLQKAIDKYDESNNTPDEKIEHSSSQKGIDTPVLKEYPALRLLSGIYYVLAWLVGLCALGCIIYGYTLLDGYSTKDLGVTIMLFSLIGGLIGFITLLAISEGIILFVNIAKDMEKLNQPK